MSDHRLPGSGDITEAQKLIAEAEAVANNDKDTAKQKLHEAIALLDNCIGSYTTGQVKDQAREQKQRAEEKLSSLG